MREREKNWNSWKIKLTEPTTYVSVWRIRYGMGWDEMVKPDHIAVSYLNRARPRTELAWLRGTLNYSALSTHRG